jgi:hypothetical protein
MNPETKNPEALAGAHRVPNVICLAAINSENSPSPLALQVQRLRRRFRFSPEVAGVVASLAYSSKGRRR